MSNHQTLQITLQPWRVSRLVNVRVTRATYTRHGRQKWELLATWDRPWDLAEEGLQAATEQVMRLLEGCLAALEAEAAQDADDAAWHSPDSL